MAERYKHCDGCLRGVDTPVMRQHQQENRCSLVVLQDDEMMEPGACDVHMGAFAEYDEMGRYAEEPPEDDEETGCPGGWYRCQWWWSVHEYTRPVADGVYSPNRRLEKSNDRLLDEAVDWYEKCQSRWRAWRDRQSLKAIKAHKAKAKARA